MFSWFFQEFSVQNPFTNSRKTPKEMNICLVSLVNTFTFVEYLFPQLTYRLAGCSLGVEGLLRGTGMLNGLVLMWTATERKSREPQLAPLRGVRILSCWGDFVWVIMRGSYVSKQHFIYSWLCWIFVAAQAFLYLQHMGFSLRWFLLLQGTGSRMHRLQ